jgi:hypothetical protein
MFNKTNEDPSTSLKEGEDKTSPTNEKVAISDEDKISGKEGELDKETLLAQKVHYRDKAQKAEEEKEKLQKELETLREQTQSVSTEKETGSAEKTGTSDNLWKQRVDFLLSHPGSTQEEVEFLSTVAQGTGKSLASLAEEGTIKEFLSLQRRKVEEEKKSLDPSSRTSDSTFRDELSKMSNEELKERYPEIVQRIVARKQGKEKI